MIKLIKDYFWALVLIVVGYWAGYNSYQLYRHDGVEKRAQFLVSDCVIEFRMVNPSPIYVCKYTAPAEKEQQIQFSKELWVEETKRVGTRVNLYTGVNETFTAAIAAGVVSLMVTYWGLSLFCLRRKQRRDLKEFEEQFWD